MPSFGAGAALPEDGTNAYPACSNEREPPGEMTLSIESVLHRQCHSEHGGVQCLTSVTGATDAWGDPCTAGFGAVAPGYHVRFEVGQTVTVNYRSFSGGSSGSGYGVSVSPVGVVRDDSSSIVVGAGAFIHGQGVVPTWFSGINLEPGEEVCEDGFELEFKTPEGEHCTVTPGSTKTCQLWGGTYSVGGGAFKGQGTNFIITRTDAMIPGSL